MHRLSVSSIGKAAAAVVVVTFLFPGAATPARAQETGAVRGSVTLVEGGDPVHGATILVLGAGRFALTDERGAFDVGGLPPGEYEVLAQREHLTAERQMVTVAAGETVTVDFALEFSLVHHEDMAVTATVSGAETAFEAFNAVTTLDSFDLIGESAVGLGDALQHAPGIASRSFGPGTSRPIIRGFDGDRVLILEDGVRTGDLSSQSGDHGVSIDPNGAERIEIVRGPATLLYGSNAVGGVVNVITPHESFRESPFDGTRAQFSADAGSANRQAGTNASLQHALGAAVFWGSGSVRRTGAYETPEGTVENSETELTNVRAGLGWFGDRLFASGGVTAEDGRYGVPFAGMFHDHGHGEDHDDHDDDHGDEDAHADDAEDADIDLDFRRRAGRFDVGLRNLDNRVIEGVRVSLNVIDWSHDEIEIDHGVDNVGTRFMNRAWVVRADVDQQQVNRLSGRFGAWMQFRDFEAVGVEALAPPTDQTAFAAFAYEELTFGRYRVQFGGRIEQNDYRTTARVGGGHAHDADHDDHDADHDDDHDADHDDDHDADHDDDHDADHDDDHDADHDDDHDADHDDDHDADHDDDHDADHDDDHHEEARPAPDPRDRQFRGASASIGLRADLGAGSAFVANFTRSHRAPAIEELYNFGPHAGSLSFDIGNPALDAETTLGLDLSFRHRTARVRGDFNFYVYDIDSFIYGDRTGEVRDNLQVLDFVQGDSRFVGFDATGSVRLGGRAWATLGLGLVEATLTPTGEPLPFIPPLRGTLSLDLPYGGFTVSPRLSFAARQDDVHRSETETAGYAVVDLRASYVWPGQHTAHVLTLTGYNLTNALYRNHTSFIKDFAPESGRGVRVGYSLRFF